MRLISKNFSSEESKELLPTKEISPSPLLIYPSASKSPPRIESRSGLTELRIFFSPLLLDEGYCGFKCCAEVIGFLRIHLYYEASSAFERNTHHKGASFLGYFHWAITSAGFHCCHGLSIPYRTPLMEIGSALT
jgi:hypothetical protein